MPWFVWMGFLTAPVAIGIACTLASHAPDDPSGFEVVAIAGGVWLFIAYHLMNRLKAWSPTRWSRWWMTLTVILPLLGLFVRSLHHDPEVMRIVEMRQQEAVKPAPEGVAAAAPARRTFTWTEWEQLVARMRPLAGDYLRKLFTAMPPVWWFLAFGIGLWRGR